MKRKLVLQDIVDYIAQHEGLNLDEADTFVRAFFDTVEQGLLEDKIVKIKGLGTFKLVAVSERESVNINTGERFQIEGHSKISFTPDNSMKELINRPFAHFEAVELSENTDTEEFNEVDKKIESEFERNEEDSEEDDEVNDTDEDNSDSEDEGEDQTDDEPSNNESDLPEKTTVAPIPFEIEDTFMNQESEQSEQSKNTADNSSMSKEEFTESKNAEQNSLTQTIELDMQAPSDDTQQYKGMQENQTDKTPQPTTIAPTDLATSSEKHETAKIRIDSNEEDTEAIQSAKVEPAIESTHTDNTEISEEEIVVTSPRPITSNPLSPHTSHTMGYAYVEVPSRKKVNWWKRGVLTFLFLLSLVLSYFVGYYNLLCPCIRISTPPVTEIPEKPQTVQVKAEIVDNSEPLTLEADSGKAVTNQQQFKTEPVSTKEEETLHKDADKTKAQQTFKKSYNDEVDHLTDKRKVVKTDKAAKIQEIKPKNVVNNKPKQESKQIRTHQVKVGDTLYKIARKYYGTENAIHKIIEYNHLKDADHIQLGMTLRLP